MLSGMREVTRLSRTPRGCLLTIGYTPPDEAVARLRAKANRIADSMLMLVNIALPILIVVSAIVGDWLPAAALGGASCLGVFGRHAPWAPPKPGSTGVRVGCRPGLRFK